jgi:hypothetical protein
MPGTLLRNCLCDTFSKYIVVRIPFIDEADSLFLSFDGKEPCLRFPLCAGVAKQNFTKFTNSGLLATLLFVLKYTAHFSWENMEQNFFQTLSV